MYILLCGYPPFNADNDPEIMKVVEKGKYSFPDEDWASVSPMAKDLIKEMLILNPDKRFSAEQCLNHPWIKSYTSGQHIDAPILANALTNMKKLK